MIDNSSQYYYFINISYTHQSDSLYPTQTQLFHRTHSHTLISQGPRQWNAYNINKMVQVAITLAKMMVSLLFRRLIFWIKLLMTGKRSLNMLRSFTMHWFIHFWIFLRCLFDLLSWIYQKYMFSLIYFYTEYDRASGIGSF